MTRQLEPGQLPGTPGPSGLICAECVPTIPSMAALSWCDCRGDGEQCRGPCRTRVHTPDRCPFRDAYVPLPIRWSQVKVGDVIRGRDGALLFVTAVTGPGPEGAGMAVVDQAGSSRPLLTKDPNHPVPVLVRYAERAALLTLRAGGTGPTLLERP